WMTWAISSVSGIGPNSPSNSRTSWPSSINGPPTLSSPSGGNCSLGIRLPIAGCGMLTSATRIQSRPETKPHPQPLSSSGQSSVQRICEIGRIPKPDCDLEPYRTSAYPLPQQEPFHDRDHQDRRPDQERCRRAAVHQLLSSDGLYPRAGRGL